MVDRIIIINLAKLHYVVLLLGSTGNLSSIKPNSMVHGAGL